MNTTRKRYLKQLALGITLVLLIFFTSSVLSQEKPPTPKELVTNLKMPKPVISQKLKGKATLPKQVKLGFGLDLADTLLSGNWDIKGKVTAIEAEKVSFTTDQGEVGNLVFRLPKGLQLSLSADEPVFIKRATRIHGATLGYKLVLESSGRKVVTSGRHFSASPQKVEIWDGLTLEQSRELEQTLSESKYETTYQVLVTLITDGRKIQLSPGEIHEVTVHGKTYKVLVHQSSKVVPTKEYEGVAEGSGYALQYVAVLK